jgi:K+ transporter
MWLAYQSMLMVAKTPSLMVPRDALSALQLHVYSQFLAGTGVIYGDIGTSP